jgi:hypothetical protein
LDGINSDQVFLDIPAKIKRVGEQLTRQKQLNPEAKGWIQLAPNSLSLVDVKEEQAGLSCIHWKLEEARARLQELRQKDAPDGAINDHVLCKFMNILLDFERNSSRKKEPN